MCIKVDRLTDPNVFQVVVSVLVEVLDGDETQDSVLAYQGKESEVVLRCEDDEGVDNERGVGRNGVPEVIVAFPSEGEVAQQGGADVRDLGDQTIGGVLWVIEGSVYLVYVEE